MKTDESDMAQAGDGTASAAGGWKSTGIDWTAERIEILRKHWGKPGWSAQRIAAEVGGGCTKNGVISKARRIGLERLESPIRRTSPHLQARVASDAGASVAELADRTGLSPKTIRQIRQPQPASPGVRIPARVQPRRTAPPARPRAPAVAAAPLQAPSGPGIEVGAQSRYECSAPLWDDDTPIDDRRVCGAPVACGSYCLFHGEKLLVRPRPRTAQVAGAA